MEHCFRRSLGNEPTRQPTALTVPTRLNMKLGKGCRYAPAFHAGFKVAVTLRELELCTPLISAMNTQRHMEPFYVFPRGLHFHIVPFVQTRLSILSGVNFAYIKLNIPTPCPPRSVVPVNRPLGSQCRCWANIRAQIRSDMRLS